MVFAPSYYYINDEVIVAAIRKSGKYTPWVNVGENEVKELMPGCS